MNAVSPAFASPAGCAATPAAVAKTTAALSAISRMLRIALSSAAVGDDVDQRRLAAFHDLDGALDRGRQILRILDRPLCVEAVALRDLGVIGRGIVDQRADIDVLVVHT